MACAARRLTAVVLVLAGSLLLPATAGAAPWPGPFSTTPAPAIVGQPTTFGTPDGVCDVEGVICTWTIDDVVTGTGRSVVHTFTTTGTHVVRLDIVSPDPDSTGFVAASVDVVDPPPPNRDPGISFVAAASGLTASFSAAASDPDGDPVTVTWTFGDGTGATGADATHTYLLGGTYTVTATATDGRGGSAVTVRTVTVQAPPPPPNRPPTVSFTSSTSGLTAAFAAATSDADGDPVTVTWSFGDGSTATGTRVSHTYAAGGSYTVTAIVRDPDGAAGADTDRITVTSPPPANRPPTVSFSYLTSGLSASFAATAADPDEGDQVTVSWSFGDGSDPVTGRQVTHDYDEPGSYTVTAIARDERGAVGTAQLTVSVVAPPPGTPETPAPAPEPPETSTAPPAAGVEATGFSTSEPGEPATGGSTPAPVRGMRAMSPFPVVRVAGRFSGRATVLTIVAVRASRRARVLVLCTGRGCPYARRSFRGLGTRNRRVTSLEGRRLRSGTILEVRVTQPGRIGKRTRLRFAVRRAPARTDGCLTPAGRPVRCPA